MATEVQATPWVVRYAKLRHQVDKISATGIDHYLSVKDQLALIELRREIESLPQQVGRCDHAECTRTFEMPMPMMDNPLTGEVRGARGSHTWPICELDSLVTLLSNDLHDIEMAIQDAVEYQVEDRGFMSEYLEPGPDGSYLYWCDQDSETVCPYLPGSSEPSDSYEDLRRFAQGAVDKAWSVMSDEEKREFLGRWPRLAVSGNVPLLEVSSDIESEKRALATREAVQEARQRVEKARRDRKRAKTQARRKRRKEKRRGMARRIWSWVKDKARRAWSYAKDVGKKAQRLAKQAYAVAKKAYRMVRPYVAPVIDFAINVGKAAEKAKLMSWLARLGRFAARLRFLAVLLPTVA